MLWQVEDRIPNMNARVLRTGSPFQVAIFRGVPRTMIKVGIEADPLRKHARC